MIGSNSKLFSIILISLLGLSGLLYLLFVFGAIDSGLLINWCFVLFGIAVLVAIVFPAIGMARDFKKSLRSIIGVGVLLVIFGLGMMLATDETYKVGELVVEGGVSQKAEAGLITFYVMIVIAIGTILYTEFSKAFK